MNLLTAKAVRRALAAALVLATTSGPALGLEFKRVLGLSLASYSCIPDYPVAGLSVGTRVLPAFGAGFIYRITEHLSLDVHGQYFRKGTYINYSNGAVRLGQYRYDLRVISLPVCLRYSLLRGSSPYVLGGLEVSYILSHEVKYYPEGQTVGTVEDIISKTRRLDLAQVLGGGYEFYFGKRFVGFLEVRWYGGLVNLSRNIEDYPTIKSRALSIQVGYRSKRKPFPFS